MSYVREISDFVLTSFKLFTFKGVLLLLFDWNHKYVKYKPVRDEMQTIQTYAIYAGQMTFFSFRFKIMLQLICFQPASRHHYSSGASHCFP
jgi:hypothetical protein